MRKEERGTNERKAKNVQNTNTGGHIKENKLRDRKLTDSCGKQHNYGQALYPVTSKFYLTIVIHETKGKIIGTLYSGVTREGGRESGSQELAPFQIYLSPLKWGFVILR